MAAVSIGRLICLLSLMPSISASKSPCSWTNIQQTTLSNLDCKDRSLTSLPKHLFGSNVISLDLSKNHFKTLSDSPFRNLVNLKKLNISYCGIGNVSEDLFRGLDLLEELDMKNNPVVGSRLPEKLFQFVPRLRRLLMSGYIADPEGPASAIRLLSGLEELAISVDLGRSPTFLVDLPRLRSLYVVGAVSNMSLGRSFLDPLAVASIEQLALIGCGLRRLEQAAFDGFSSLDVLNLANNPDLQLDDVIDVLSGSANLSLSTLILDAIGTRRRAVLLGERDYPDCRSIWIGLRRLSVAGTNLASLGDNFLRCLTNVEFLRFGHNDLTFTNRYRSIIIMRSLLNARLIDFSYLGTSTVRILKILNGFHRSENWIKRNDDYFEPPLPPPPSGHSDWPTERKPYYLANCSGLSLPVRLEYLIADHVVKSPASHFHHDCIRFFPNRLRFVSVDHNLYRSGLELKWEVYGLDRLEVFDLSATGLVSLNLRTFAHTPALRTLNLADNWLGRRPMEAFPATVGLQELDLSRNAIRSLPSDAFSRLRALRRLVLAGNRLEALTFDLPETLRYLDLSGNVMLTLDDGARRALNVMTDVMIDLGDNPLLCGCDELPFVEWLRKTPTDVVNRELITCYERGNVHNVTELDVDHLRSKCNVMTLPKIAIAVAAGILLIVIIVVTGVIISRRRQVKATRPYEIMLED